MNYSIATLAVLKFGIGLNQRAAHYRLLEYGLTKNDIARSILVTPRYTLMILSKLAAGGAVRYDSDFAGQVGRPAYRWYLNEDSAVILFCGSNDPQHAAQFWDDAISELYAARAARRAATIKSMVKPYEHE